MPIVLVLEVADASAAKQVQDAAPLATGKGRVLGACDSPFGGLAVLLAAEDATALYAKEERAREDAAIADLHERKRDAQARLMADGEGKPELVAVPFRKRLLSPESVPFVVNILQNGGLTDTERAQRAEADMLRFMGECGIGPGGADDDDDDDPDDPDLTPLADIGGSD